MLGILSLYRVEPVYTVRKCFRMSIHLKVAKDTGDIIGLDASEYIQERKDAIDNQLRKWIGTNFSIQDVQIVQEELAYVENERIEQRLAHYLTVTRG